MGNKYKDALIQSMQYSSEQEINSLNVDKTVNGRVIGTSDGKYIVEIYGDKYTIPSSLNATFSTNDNVWVCRPEGNIERQFIVGGVYSDNGEIVTTVSSVNNKTGDIVLTKNDIGLNNVDNTSDLDKPINNATQIELDKKVDKTSVLTDVPENAKFTDTITTVNGKTGEITKDDIVALGIPSQDTTYTSYPASKITEDSTHKFVTDIEKNNWNNGNHTHNNLSLLQTITQTLINNWNNAVSHISDTARHITSAERSLWNTISNKVDKVSGKQLSTNDYTTTEKTKLSGIENNANNYTHPSTHPSTMITGLTKVANTGDYNDLINKPLILNGKDGKDGYTPIKGIDYFDGKDGKDGLNGKDGYTPIKNKDYFDGYTPVKNVDYFDGKDGKDGAKGESGITVPLNTFFSMYVKANGDLIAVVADGGTKPPLSIKNGQLIYTI